MASNSSRPVSATVPQRWGLWLLVAGGTIIAVLTALWLTHGGSDAGNPAQMAKEQASFFFVLVFGWLQILAFVALLLGLAALYGVLSRRTGSNLALGGLVLGTLSLSAVIAGFGAAMLGGAVVADSYLRGNTGALDALHRLSGGSFGTAILQALIAGTILSALSAVATGVAIWRSAVFPLWSAVAFGVGFVLAVASFPLISTVGGVLLAVSGFTLARTIRGESEDAVSPAHAQTA